MTTLRSHIDLIENADQPDTRISVHVMSYYPAQDQAIDPSDAPTAFILTVPASDEISSFRQFVRQQVLSITGFRPSRFRWSKLSD